MLQELLVCGEGFEVIGGEIGVGFPFAGLPVGCSPARGPSPVTLLATVRGPYVVQIPRRRSLKPGARWTRWPAPVRLSRSALMAIAVASHIDS